MHLRLHCLCWSPYVRKIESYQMSCRDKRIGDRAGDFFSRNLKWPLLLFSILVWIPLVKNFLLRTKEASYALRSFLCVTKLLLLVRFVVIASIHLSCRNSIRSPLSVLPGRLFSHDWFDNERRRGIECKYDYYLMFFLIQCDQSSICKSYLTIATVWSFDDIPDTTMHFSSCLLSTTVLFCRRNYEATTC